MTSSAPSNQKSKKELFREICEENFNYVYRFVFSRLAGNIETTKDIVQETFFAALKSFEKFKGKSSWPTWLCSIAKHKIIDYYRKEIDRINSDVELVYEIEAQLYIKDFDDLIIKNEQKDTVIKALGKIQPKYKFSLILKYIEGYSIKDIGKILNITPKAADGILQRAKIIFKKEFMILSNIKRS